MARIDPRIADFCEAAERLPNGGSLVIQDLQWDDCEAVLDAMSPLTEHEIAGLIIDRMIYFYCDEFDIMLEGYRSSTWKRRSLGKGVEPGECYYVENAARIIGKRKFDLEIDPPPDFVVEINITNSSLRKFPIYAALRVPEIWRYDRKTVHFHGLATGSFVETAQSRFLPGLTGQIMVETIKASVEWGKPKPSSHFGSKFALRIPNKANFNSVSAI